MTLLPSFNRNGTERTTQIQTSLDSRITGIKRLAALDPNFFLFQRAGALKSVSRKK